MSEIQSWQKEQVSVAFVHALATRHGYTIGTWRVDKDGVDVTLRDRGLMVDLQLKCTSSPTITSGGFSYQLDVSTYDKLRDPMRSAPGYLALLVVPSSIDEWIVHSPQSILLACCGYWARVQDMTREAAGDTTAIALPDAHKLDGLALERMFMDSRTLVCRSVA